MPNCPALPCTITPRQAGICPKYPFPRMLRLPFGQGLTTSACFCEDATGEVRSVVSVLRPYSWGKPGTDGTVPIFSAQCGNGTDSRDPEIAGSPAKFESFLIFSANGPLRSRRRGGRWASCYASLLPSSETQV